MGDIEMFTKGLLKMWWLWVPPTIILIAYCIHEAKEDRKKSRRSDDNYLK